MSFYLLSWHGTLAGYTGMHMHPASFAEVYSRAVAPVILYTSGLLEPCGAFVQAQPVESVSGHHLIALKADTHYVCCRPTGEFAPSPLCAAWEHFLAVPTELLPALRDLTARNWFEGTRFLGKAICVEHEIVLGERKWPVHGLHAERRGDSLTLWNEASAERTVLRLCPSSSLASLMEMLTERLETSSIHPALTPWATLEALRGHMLLVSLTPENTGHILHLARICGLFEQWDLAAGFLACAQTQDERPDLLWFAAILALRTTEYGAAAALTEQALTTRFPDRPILAETQDLLDALKAGKDMLFLFPAKLHALGLPAFEDLFDQLLLPMPLSPQSGRAEKQAYSTRFEEACTQQDVPHRLRLLAAEVRANGQSYWEEINMGHASWLNDLRAEADAHYATARTLALQGNISPIHYNCGVFTWLSEAASKALVGRTMPDHLGLSSWTWHFSPEAETQPELCLVFGCDSRYFEFIPKLILSLIRACRADSAAGRLELCIGVDQPTMEQLNFLTKVAEWLEEHEPRLGLNFAHGTLTSRTPATYTAIRYLMLPAITARYSCPVMTADCDGYFPQDFISLWREMQQTADYGFRLYAYDQSGKQIHGEPWGFGAGLSYFGEAEKLPDIASFLSNYLNTAYNPQNPTNWCVDQCALAQAFREFVAPRWHDLRIKFIDDGTPLMIMPHHVGGKRALLEHGGTVTQADVLRELSDYAPEQQGTATEG